ncbi:hypothetical protein GDO86_005549 [Hymenochirus boettgeri]|uniref:G protein-regulated inducer of neurite outgrowth C-terminal domain-containing protein n=1 Tax=Hymenochirus boettgeri TaxID=247094 RepID=A0A8T2J7L3_9PIPI|nr:hypothetical protein GDO86_005549 [Hymenochirus boettgeri]
MDSPKKPQRLQLSGPESANDNASLPEKRSPISSRIWQEEDPTRNPLFSGEDRSMRNFCIRVQGDHELMEGSFSFDFDGDSSLTVQRDKSIDFVSHLPDQNPKGGMSLNKVDKMDTFESELESTSTTSAVQDTKKAPQKDNESSNGFRDGKRKCTFDDNEKDRLISQASQQLDTDKPVSLAGHSSESQSVVNKLPKGPEKSQEHPGKTLDAILGSSSCISEFEIAKGETSHPIGFQEISPKNPTQKKVGIEPNSKDKMDNTEGSSLLIGLKDKEISDQTHMQSKSSKSDSTKDSQSGGESTSEGALSKKIKQGNENRTTDISSSKEGGIEASSGISTLKTAELTPFYEDTNKKCESTTYRSIAVSPIVPPEGNVSFNFQTGTRIQEASDVKFRSVAVSPFISAEGLSSFVFQSGVSTQENPSLQYRSVAVSPIFHPEGSSSFDFQSGTQKTSNIQYRSVAVSPIVQSEGGSLFSFQSAMETQDNSNKQYRSVAVSPIVPPEGNSSFSFQGAIGTKETSNVEYRSVAVSPIFPPDGSSSFNFQSGLVTQDGSNVQYRSVAVSPIFPPDGNSSFHFQSATGNREPKVQYRSVAVSPIVVADGSSSFAFQCEGSCQSKVCSELKLSNKDTGNKTRVECRSVAVSPIIPPDQSTFQFQTQLTSSNAGMGEQKSSSYTCELGPPCQDERTQKDPRVECVSVAVSPFVPTDSASSFVFKSEDKQQELTFKTGAEENKIASKDKLTTYQEGGKNLNNVVQYVSVAVSPIVVSDSPSSFTFQAENKVCGVSADQTKNKDVKDCKTYSFELTPPDQGAGKDPQVEYKSVAVSPIVLPEEYSFTFKTEKKKTYSFEITPPTQDVGVQTDNVSESVSVALSPFVFSQGPAAFTFKTEGRQQEEFTRTVVPQTHAPQIQDCGTQTDSTIQCTSIAISPFIPIEGSSSFQFHPEGPSQHLPVVEKPQMKDAEIQVSFTAEMRSVATDPMTPIGKSPRTTYPEVQVKEAKVDHPEPVREVNWDEKGMTWEVYGASMEVEVLGMAIQKHLEKQIEEHGRQKVMTPQNTRGSSLRCASVKSEGKRPPGTVRTFFHRKPRCCSGAGPAVE